MHQSVPRLKKTERKKENIQIRDQKWRPHGAPCRRRRRRRRRRRHRHRHHHRLVQHHCLVKTSIGVIKR
ncbi:putative uncharacterized protein YOR053W [Drosophila grimshawi]|uniref:putative uncharacterized protein YOR053W n=1 Tax=Drosophila grimshawi TaxID=7222 RepID=UPI0013EEED35|nr:putative uncharacterized protein YOR053W [Drosophila grimshawi]